MPPADGGPAGAAPAEDSAAIRAVAREGGALCTIVNIDGSYSRRLGAQLAILPDGALVGSLADGCLEAQLVQDAQVIGGQAMRLMRYGRGSPNIDFRLPCGSGIDIAIDTAPDAAALAEIVGTLDARRAAALRLPLGRGEEFVRPFAPSLRLVVLGSGPEVDALDAQARAFGVVPELWRPFDGHGPGLSLGRVPDIAVDSWTALAILFHDHEWERVLLPWALGSDAFYVGAQGGEKARLDRMAMLGARGLDAGRLRSPAGLIPRSREPAVLALSILAEIVQHYEQLREGAGRKRDTIFQQIYTFN